MYHPNDQFVIVYQHQEEMRRGAQQRHLVPRQRKWQAQWLETLRAAFSREAVQPSHVRPMRSLANETRNAG